MKPRYVVLMFGFMWFHALPLLRSEAPRRASFNTGNRSISYEVFEGMAEDPILILLHGASGPDMPLYRSQAKFFNAKGYTVLLLHYFDATGSSTPSNQNYDSWVKAVQELVRQCATDPKWSKKKIALIGYSLGASVALGAGSQRTPVSAIAEWYGSLPDEFFYHFQGMPPLLILHGDQDTNIPVINAQQLMKLCGLKQLTCESHIYPNQGHGFTGKDLDDADSRTVDFLSRKLK